MKYYNINSNVEHGSPNLAEYHHDNLFVNIVSRLDKDLFIIEVNRHYIWFISEGGNPIDWIKHTDKLIQSKFLLLLKATNAYILIFPSPSGSQWLIISLTSAGVISSPNSSAAVIKSYSEINPLPSSSKF